MLIQLFTQLDALVTLAMSHITANPSTQRILEAASTSDPVSGFLQYGVLGLVVIGFITGWIVPGPQFKAMSVENARLSTLIDDKVFPMLETNAKTMERAAMALEKAADAMDRQANREQLMQERIQRESR